MIARAAVRSPLARLTPWISTVIRLVLAGILIAAGSLKAIDPASSVAAVEAYELLPAAWATPVGVSLPFVEIALGLVLASGIATRPAAIATAALFAVFIAAVVVAEQRGLSIDCGCFGGGGSVAAGQTAYAGELARDTAFLLMALWLAWQPESKLALTLGGDDR